MKSTGSQLDPAMSLIFWKCCSEAFARADELTEQRSVRASSRNYLIPRTQARSSDEAVRLIEFTADSETV